MNGSISTMYNVEIAQRKNDDTEISYQKSEIVDEHNCNDIGSQKSDNQDESSEDQGEIPADVTDTMLTPTDFLEDNE